MLDHDSVGCWCLRVSVVPDLPPALQVPLDHLHHHALLQVYLILVPGRVGVHHRVLLLWGSDTRWVSTTESFSSGERTHSGSAGPRTVSLFAEVNRNNQDQHVSLSCSAGLVQVSYGPKGEAHRLNTSFRFSELSALIVSLMASAIRRFRCNGEMSSLSLHNAGRMQGSQFEAHNIESD